MDLLGFWFLVNVKILERQTDVTQELVPSKITSMKNLQGDLRPVPILRNLPDGINYMFVKIMTQLNYIDMMSLWLCLYYPSPSTLTKPNILSTYNSHCSNHSGFSLFSLTDVWNFSLPRPIVTKASFVPKMGTLSSYIHPSHNRDSFSPFFPLIFRPFALLTRNNKS